MRFRKGDKVEVMNKHESAISWRPAEILSGNGIAYWVQYEFYCGFPSEQLVERVPCKLVRPCPPLVQGVEHYVTGDVVEVFYESSWKISAILKVLGGKKGNMNIEIRFQDASLQNQYLVRLLGCSKELIISQADIRMRQTWHDGRWILLEKCCRGGKDVIARMDFEVPEGDGKVTNKPQKYCFTEQDNISFLKLPKISSRPRKRKRLYQSSTTLAFDERVRELREIKKDGKELRLVAAPVLEKVDAVASQREIFGEKNMHPSFNITSDGYNQKERRKQNDVPDFSGVRNSEANGSDSDACSVGSCSITDKCPNNYYSHLISQCWRDTDTLSTDAESVCSVIERKRCSLPPKEEIEVNIRKLELHAYRCTLQVLYASGPLSWEQETLLTNLRIMLHISNDEHLKELKHLLSAKTAVFV
ncbi:hypothetical protein F511_00460 [Dorcoceras hygrometricum]|uniref:ENT domain-containing protein n=1 Tax=Dorcoceras hygrometricum TaxID=472368 RepID=A0A2Z7BI87_9LAMI|nr:hypothetical protein F511_00460 [Dorcoceras hygrometricum]